MFSGYSQYFGEAGEAGEVGEYFGEDGDICAGAVTVSVSLPPLADYGTYKLWE